LQQWLRETATVLGDT